jgi:Tfp pilus assembly protein PilE
MNKGRGFSKITIVLVVLVAAILGAGTYFAYTWWQGRTNVEKTQTTPTPSPNPRMGWTTYIDRENGFSLQYPSSWTAKEGSFPSTHGQTLKDMGFAGENIKVFVTVRSNPEGVLKAFVDADGLSNVQPAQIDSPQGKLDGFAGLVTGAYRVYLGKDNKIYMFTFPGAQSNNDLSADQVNILTSFQFTGASTPPTTPTTTPTP